jgi:RHS repeat-associated protein
LINTNGYVYIWVSNESKEARVWFDDLTITHTEHIVVQATDYGAWGDVIREQKSDLASYRYGYQGQFAEKDEETGWSHFELREYDPVVGRWTAVDPKRIGFSPYVGMGNDPVNMVDPDGGGPWKPDENGNLVAEAGDNAATLADYLGVSIQDATAIFNNYANWMVVV